MTRATLARRSRKRRLTPRQLIVYPIGIFVICVGLILLTAGRPQDPTAQELDRALELVAQAERDLSNRNFGAVRKGLGAAKQLLRKASGTSASTPEHDPPQDASDDRNRGNDW